MVRCVAVRVSRPCRRGEGRPFNAALGPAACSHSQAAWEISHQPTGWSRRGAARSLDAARSQRGGRELGERAYAAIPGYFSVISRLNWICFTGRQEAAPVILSWK